MAVVPAGNNAEHPLVINHSKKTIPHHYVSTKIKIPGFVALKFKTSQEV